MVIAKIKCWLGWHTWHAYWKMRAEDITNVKFCIWCGIEEEIPDGE